MIGKDIALNGGLDSHIDLLSTKHLDVSMRIEIWQRTNLLCLHIGLDTGIHSNSICTC